MKTERGDYQLAYFDGHEWFIIDLTNKSFQTSDLQYTKIELKALELSKRSTFLHGIFVNAYIVGNVICSEPQMLFLHGIRYDLEDSGLTPLQVIIDNAKDMGI